MKPGQRSARATLLLKHRSCTIQRDPGLETRATCVVYFGQFLLQFRTAILLRPGQIVTQFLRGTLGPCGLAQ